MAFQVSVFLENKQGHLRKVSSALHAAGINIRTMTLSTTTLGWGVLNLIVSDPEKAIDILHEQNLSATLRKIIVLEMTDQPGGLDEMLGKLDDAQINIENCYGRVIKEGKSAFLVVDVQDIDALSQRLAGADVTVLSDEFVYGEL